MATAAPLCRVCRERAAEYTCPRCNARYCSLDCYKRHSDRCTEGFYRDAAVSELQSVTAGEDEQRHMLEILQRMHQQEVEGSGSSSDEEEEEEGGLSAETLHRLMAKMAAAGGALDIGAEDLAPAELAAFHRALAAGELSGAVQPWDPWWLSEEALHLELSASGTPLVAAVEQEQQQQQQAGSEPPGPGEASAGPVGSSMLPPPPSRPLPLLSALTKAAPSPRLRYQLLDLLYSYCYTLRLYNGDYEWEAADAAGTLFALSAVLAAATGSSSSSSAPGSQPAGGGSGSSSDAEAAAPALLGCVQRACQPPVGSRDDRALAVGVLSDVAAVLRQGRHVVLTALMDTSRLVEAARQQLEGSGPSSGGSSGGGEAAASSRTKQQQKELRRRLVAAERKLLFFLSWANEQQPEEYEMLAMAVAAEHQKHAAALGGKSTGGPQAGAAAARAVHQRAAGHEVSRAVLIEEL